jgi:hypothetical protein
MRHGLVAMGVLAGGVLAGGVLPVQAAESPRLRPTRDVEVEYRLIGMPQTPSTGLNGSPGGGPGAGMGGGLTIHFTTKGNRLRVEGANGRGYAIIDRDAGRMLMVMTEKRIYMEMPRDIASDPNVLEGLESGKATFRKTGSDTVAGLSCTIYETAYEDRKGRICLTDDGVWLRAASGDPNHPREMEAVKVTYADQPAALFEPPAGFQKFEMPGGAPPGMGGAPMGPNGGNPRGNPGGTMPGGPPGR